MTTLIHARVAAAQAGNNPTVICRMPSGWAVLCDVQFLRGYSLLLSDPVVPDLNALDREHRAQYLLDMATIGDALMEDFMRADSEELKGADCGRSRPN